MDPAGDSKMPIANAATPPATIKGRQQAAG